MGSKNKLKRFRENDTFKNVIQPTREQLTNEEFHLKGTWHSFFKNNNPIQFLLNSFNIFFICAMASILTMLILLGLYLFFEPERI